ncbi:MAG TPA: transcription repressor NadR [Candidatus Mediterraneibacter cottocaccae]|nr:transcription repressor NadR [Candidatus Mediterraneibacter cottocaccae]
MTGTDRRKAIVEQIRHSAAPVPGKALAAEYDVSRQVIVQDIALIRASGYNVLSTNRGYVLNEPSVVNRVFKVKHTDEQLEDELNSIVDLGGIVRNVMVNHKVYGHLEAELNVTSRRKAAEFMEEIRSGKSSPLKNITSGYHYHTVEADSEETLNLIENMLKEKGYLVERPVSSRP